MGVCALVLVGWLAGGLSLVDTHAPPVPIGRDVEVLVDDGGRFDLASAMASPGWRRSRSTDVTVGMQEAVMWVRFDVAVVAGADWLLWARFPRPRQIDHWTLRDGVVVAHQKSGLDVPQDRRPVDDVEVLLPLGGTVAGARPTPASRATHVLRATSQPARLSLVVGTVGAIAASRADDGIVAGLYYGIFVGLFLFNLAFGFATRDVTHLLYCVFVVCMGMHMAVRDGWLPPELPDAVFHGGAGMPLTGLIMLAFTRRFLGVDVDLPRFRRVYDVAIALTAVLAILPFFGFELARLGGLATILDIAVVVSSATALVKKGDRPAALFLLAWALMIVAVVLAILHSLGVVDLPWASTEGVRLGAAVEMILLSLALAARVGVLRQGKERAERALADARLGRQHEILQKVLAAQESERERFARDLHDGLGHTLLLLKQRSATEAPGLKEPLAHCLDDVRRLARDLAPATLERLGLVSAVEALGASHQKATGVKVVVACAVVDDDVKGLGSHAIHAYRVVQECLTNATRHGAAQRIDVDMRVSAGLLQLRVADDGCGVDGVLVPGTGVTGMEQRARLLGGSFSFESGKDGTVVVVVVPLVRPAPIVAGPTP